MEETPILIICSGPNINNHNEPHLDAPKIYYDPSVGGNVLSKRPMDITTLLYPACQYK